MEKISREEADEAGKLQALREAIQVGDTALEHGVFKEFHDAESLRSYLMRISNIGQNN